MGMQLIETIEVGAGGAASIEFTGIPQDGVDLMLELSLRGAGGITLETFVRANGSSSSSDYAYVMLQGRNGAVGSLSAATYPGNPIFITGNGNTANTFGSTKMLIANYTSSTAKSTSSDSISENNTSLEYYAYQLLIAGKFNTTSPITSLTLVTSSAIDFEQYSTASLYKITAD